MDQALTNAHSLNFSDRLLDWFDRHGRKNLPWQNNPTPYRVWISEIMLQQTQVSTVIPYYKRFMTAFPDIQALAEAPLDRILNLWTGLGYYARARNLHKTSQIVCEKYHGCFPLDMDTMQTLPGIGRSTAGAILALACGLHHPILDGNVKRVLCRLHAIEGWPGQKQVENRLWHIAEKLTPEKRVAEYTQAIMDLGATLCTRSKPACTQCPLNDVCQANRTARQMDFPTPKPKKTLPVRRTCMLIIANTDDAILLEKRPAAGLWGGLLSLPEVPQPHCESDNALSEWASTCLHCDIRIEARWSGFRHTFSHFHLDITPVIARLKAPVSRIMEAESHIWYNKQQQTHGLAAPVKKLLDLFHLQLHEQGNT